MFTEHSKWLLVQAGISMLTEFSIIFLVFSVSTSYFIHYQIFGLQNYLVLKIRVCLIQKKFLSKATLKSSFNSIFFLIHLLRDNEIKKKNHDEICFEFFLTLNCKVCTEGPNTFASTRDSQTRNGGKKRIK